jgi:hypothetical protein
MTPAARPQRFSNKSYGLVRRDRPARASEPSKFISQRAKLASNHTPRFRPSRSLQPIQRPTPESAAHHPEPKIAVRPSSPAHSTHIALFDALEDLMNLSSPEVRSREPRARWPSTRVHVPRRLSRSEDLLDSEVRSHELHAGDVPPAPPAPLCLPRSEDRFEHRNAHFVSFPPGRRPTWIDSPCHLNTPKGTLTTRTDAPGSSYERSTDTPQTLDPKTERPGQPLDRSTLPSRSTSSSEPSRSHEQSALLTAPEGPARQTPWACNPSGPGWWHTETCHRPILVRCVASRAPSPPEGESGARSSP